MKPSTSDRKAWVYVPTLYFAEGLPYIIINTVSVIMYKKMGMSNQFIGLTSIFYLPWVIKMFWSPVVDKYGSKRGWIIWTQLLMAISFAAICISINSTFFVSFTVSAFLLTAFISATHDIAVDGYYMLALDKSQQAFYLGIRSTFYRLSVIFGSGVLVIIAGYLEKVRSVVLSWSTVMAIVASAFFIFSMFHRYYLPVCENTDDESCPENRKKFMDAFRTYFSHRNIMSITLFILLFRLGEAMLVKMASPFLLDSPGAGGLGLSTEMVGYVYGTVGVVSLCAGGILGGWIISRAGLKKTIFPMALMLNLPDALYIYMSMNKPSLAAVYTMVALEQFGYGLGFTAFSVFLLYICREPYKTSHFAISTGLMALGMMVPGMMSGIVQNLLGYTGFFSFVLLSTIPGMIMIYFIPLDENNSS